MEQIKDFELSETEKLEACNFLASAMLPYALEKRTHRGKEQYLVRKKDNVTGICLTEVVTKFIQQAEKMGIEIDLEEWKNQVMKTAPLVSREGYETIKKEMWRSFIGSCDSKKGITKEPIISR